MNGVMKYFLVSFEKLSPVIFRKAYLLALMNIIIVVVVLPVPVLVQVVRGDFMRPAAIALPALAGCMISLVMLRRGFYYAAANTTSLATSITICVGITLQHALTPGIGYSSMVYVILAGIIFSAMFCTRTWTTIITVLFITGNIIFYFAIRSSGTVQPDIATTGLIDSLLGIIFTYALAILIIRTNKQSLDDIKTESEKNRKQYMIIHELLRSSSDLSDSLSLSSDELSDTSTMFSNKTQTQAASIEEISSSIEEITASMDLVVANIHEQFSSMEILVASIEGLSGEILSMEELITEGTKISEITASDSQKGEQSIQIMNETMSAIRETSLQMNTVLSVIQQISEQINLLSLNAAIEAARAGDSGRGFAVVSDEISKLSDQTAQSLKEIQSHITNTESEVSSGTQNLEEMVLVMNRIISNISSLSDMVQRIKNVTGKQVAVNATVQEQTQTVKNKSEEIRSSIEEQKSAIYEVARSIADMNESTQLIANGSLEMSENVRGLSSMANDLKKRIRTNEEE